MSSVLPFTLDDYFQTTAVGSVDKAIGNNLFGINHRQTPTPVQMNKDQYGLTFFVRPQLNLQAANIRNVRIFYPMLSDLPKSLQRFVRCTLDPRLMYGYKIIDRGGNNASEMEGGDLLSCPLIDEKQAFIPVLTNNLNSLSGWPDIVAPTFTSKEGLYQESWSIVDGTTKIFSTFDLDATFRNTRGDPIMFLFYVWVHYSSLVFEGNLVPYPDFIIENEIDYNTRIYRLVLDQDKKYVRKIAATGASFPVQVPTGGYFDFTSERPFNDQNKDITIRFRCVGAQYQDDILIKEFNNTVVIFNPDMEDGMRDMVMMKVDASLLRLFNNRGYPRINPDNYELEWYVDVGYFSRRLEALSTTGLSTAEISDLTNQNYSQSPII